ncbi:hypothetical protein EGW08_005907 [Elysia chlorotica]|uniref:C2H2-type domain-containing protein n=1 Tax=Elysia chlorotica TaxID=188477 RepID=A0A3S0ZYP8_ELYCH|nr:hypothetical protein EGW08_005907 [Elysia chlorotica]
MSHYSNHNVPDSCDTNSLETRHSMYNPTPANSYSMYSTPDRQKNPDGKLLKCPYCRTIWFSKVEMQNHISRDHGDILPYKCSLCGKGYQTAQGLALHIQVHEGRSFPCPLCGSRFSQKGKVKRHLQNIHNASRCSTCPGYIIYIATA